MVTRLWRVGAAPCLPQLPGSPRDPSSACSLWSIAIIRLTVMGLFDLGLWTPRTMKWKQYICECHFTVFFEDQNLLIEISTHYSEMCRRFSGAIYLPIGKISCHQSLNLSIQTKQLVWSLFNHYYGWYLHTWWRILLLRKFLLGIPVRFLEMPNSGR